ncbi:MAG: tetratricopeptide repeat protein [Muribaculaceae bacterium]|nr:tetratricopeptide repeat protein [Muribaculaceae bacterium]
MMWSRFIWLFILFILGRHLAFPSSDRYIELADSADFYIAKENWNKAEEKILEALRLEPANFSNSLLLANLGLIKINKGEPKEAIEALSLGLNIAPSSTVLLNNRAHAYLIANNISLAIEDLDRSLEIDSIQEWTLSTRGFLYLQESKMEEAEKLFIKINQNFPNNSSAFSGLAAIEEKRGDLEAAKKSYLQALDLNPDDEDTREAFIFLLITSEEYARARMEIKEALNKNPDNPMYYLLRGYLHRLNYLTDEATADKKIALSKGISPDVANSFIP